MLVIDGIISNPGAWLPWEEMVAICKEEKVWSLVDAAHCIGQVDVDLAAVQPDFWVSVSLLLVYFYEGTGFYYIFLSATELS